MPALPPWTTLPLRLGALLLLAYALAGVALYLASDRLIFLPGPSSYDHGPEHVALRTSRGGTVTAVHLPNDSARFTILFSHGNAEDLGDNGGFFAALHAAGFAVLAYDYDGYGTSAGRPSEAGAYAAADAAYAHLTETLGVPPERILLHGRSLGGAVSIELASRRPAAGLVLESTFTSPSRVVFGRRVFPFDPFPSLSRISRVRVPVLVVHGTEDRTIPFAHGGELLRAADAPWRDSLWVDGAGHNDLARVAGDRYRAALRAFADRVAAAQDAAAAPDSVDATGGRGGS
jgi:fermentation-respiration switch protein FrsA (DUF1100 family)